MDTIDAFEKQESRANDGKPWKLQEIELLEKFLDRRGYIKSYHDAEDVICTLAGRLKRNEKSIKRKGIELGYGECVDYWIAKERYGLK